VEKNVVLLTNEREGAAADRFPRGSCSEPLASTSLADDAFLIGTISQHAEISPAKIYHYRFFVSSSTTSPWNITGPSPTTWRRAGGFDD
jgi:hypothetical protein